MINIARTWVTRILLVSVLCWELFVLLANSFHAAWPVSHNDRIGFGLVCFITEFLAVKIWLMTTRTERWTRLGASLIMANVSFFLLYLAIMFLSLWPQYATNIWILRLLRVQLVLILGWSIIELLITANKDDEQPSGFMTRWILMAMMLVTGVIAYQLHWIPAVDHCQLQQHLVLVKSCEKGE